MSRLQHAVSMRCLVVTQHSLEPNLDDEWADKMVVVDAKDMPERLKHFLDHPKEREAWIERAYQHSKKNYQLEDWLRKNTFLKHYMRGEKGGALPSYFCKCAGCANRSVACSAHLCGLLCMLCATDLAAMWQNLLGSRALAMMQS